MKIQLRQICVVTRDLEQTLFQLRQVLGLQAGFVDPEVERFGARNTICPLGNNFIELITPLNDEAPSHKFLTSMGGDAGYMVITQVDSRATQQAIRDKAQVLGVRAVFDVTARGADYLQWHPGDTGGSFLETTFDFRGELEGHWDPVGGYIGDQSADAFSLRIIKVGVTAEDPQGTAERWGQLTLNTVDMDGAGNPRISLNNASIYFTAPDEIHSQPGLDRVHVSSPAAGTIITNAVQMGLRTVDNTFRIGGLDFHIGFLGD